MRFDVEVNITEKQLLEEIECWSPEAIQKFIFKIMPKIGEYWTNNVDPDFTLPLAAQILQRTIKSAKYECDDNAKEMNAKLKEMIEQLLQMHEDYYKL